MRNWIKRLYRSKGNLTKEEVKEMLKNHSNVILLDVRSHQEYEEGHLNGAINIPTYELYRKASKVLKDKNAIIIAYCTVGVRSKHAIEVLRKMGYKNLYHLEGGIGS
ncbi:MAG: rhodanese-like domain-containing protein [Clostridia bacterium]|nr:rhodanese-like domain-containing protein [Clostridia bacterium]